MNNLYYMHPYPPVYYVITPMCNCWNMPGWAADEGQIPMQTDTAKYSDHLVKAPEKESQSNGNEGAVVFGRTPDQWIEYTEFLVKEGLEDTKRGINMTHILQEFILMGVLVGKGYPPEQAYETVENWERTGESKILQQSKNM